MIQVLFLGESLRQEAIDFILSGIIAWFIGRQYDKIKDYGQTIKESEESYKQLIEMLPRSVIIHQDDSILYINKAGEELLALQGKHDIIGKSICNFIEPKYKESILERIKQAQRGNKSVHPLEYKLRRLDGTTIFAELSSLPIVYGGKEAILSIGKDITERKTQIENLLQKSEKLALVGQMAAGIAHEIRNPLTSIKGFVQLFQSKYKEDTEYFDIVLSELERINLIIGEFLVLAKPTKIIFKEKDLKTLLRDVVMLINTQAILNNVQIYMEREPNLPMIACEENQLKQVFINILKNAIEAMPDGGMVHVKAKEIKDNKISICFTDQGMGIPEDRIPTLGEPFYTTKEKGTGLGLMTSYKIIEHHNGEFNISSKVNEGTTVEIILPVINLFIPKNSVQI